MKISRRKYRDARSIAEKVRIHGAAQGTTTFDEAGRRCPAGEIPGMAPPPDRRRVQGAKRFRRSRIQRLWSVVDRSYVVESFSSRPRQRERLQTLAQIVDVFFNLSDFPAVEDGEHPSRRPTRRLGCWNTSEGLSFEKEKFGWTTRRARPGDHVEFKCVVSGPSARWEEEGTER